MGFETNFLEQMKISHPHSRILANEFYQTLIRDKHHIHMNSTKWLTLTDFVKHLGRSGKCMVEETERGWYITLNQTPWDHSEQTRREIENHSYDMEKKKLREIATKHSNDLNLVKSADLSKMIKINP